MVDNAIRYSPEKSKVTIKLEKNNQQVTLRVIDNGLGILEELHAWVFERFFCIIDNQATGSSLGF